MHKTIINTGAIILAVFIMVASQTPDVRMEDILAAYKTEGEYSGLTISYPSNETLFPPEIVPPAFRWKDSKAEADTWLITIKFQDDGGT